ncbi:MAG TPA: response regulator [Roseiflexaceae bacterium]|nr:response regulator [Roseiflexaceae bacterium]
MAEPALDVLVVEDDVALRQQTSQLIELWGYRARVAQDTSAALAELDREPADIILTDLMLPDQPGYDLMRWSQQRQPSPPVLVMTAYASLESAIEALKQGAYDFLLKPITPPELAAALSRASMAIELQRSRARAEHLRHIAEVALTLAHEINNPLAVIMGELQLQLEEAAGPIDRAALDISLEAAHRIADAVRKISALREVVYQDYAGLRMLDLEATRQ